MRVRGSWSLPLAAWSLTLAAWAWGLKLAACIFLSLGLEAFGIRGGQVLRLDAWSLWLVAWGFFIHNPLNAWGM